MSLPWMEWAEGELGVHETPGPSSTSRIIQYRDISGLKLPGDDGSVPWCKIFVNAAFKEANLPILPSAMALSVKKDAWLTKLDGPAYGAITAFWRGTPKAGTGHIGFYVGQNANGSRIYVLGGNQNDAVTKAFFPASSIKFGLVGYYWPKSVALPEIKPIIVNDKGASVASAV